MRFHVIQTLTGQIDVVQKVRNSDKVLYTCPYQHRAYSYADMLKGSRSVQVPVSAPAVNRRGVQITLPATLTAN